ncbi:MAG: amino acid adenylation domain-containing protein [Bacteroidetes bacterium]|nr:amino acid adenylation domain-containing protein [Bacteroidota bacterium]
MNKQAGIIELLSRAAASGIFVSFEEGHLRMRMNQGLVADQLLISELRSRKEDITTFFLQEEITMKELREAPPPVMASSRDNRKLFPLSFAQERLWFIDKLVNSTNYHISNVLRIEGNLDKDLLSNSFTRIIERHEILRTVYIDVEGNPFQTIRQAKDWRMECLTDDHQTPYIQTIIEKTISSPFDLKKDFPVRAKLIRYNQHEWILIIVIHHIASDGLSMNIFQAELVEIYRALAKNEEPALPTLSIQYIDYALWQNEYLSGDRINRKIDHWEKILTGLQMLDLPTDFERPALMSFRGHTRNYFIGPELAKPLSLLSQEHGLTLFMTLLAAFNLLLHKYTGQTDICVGTPVANRGQNESEPLIGLFVNTIPLRNKLDCGWSFRQLLSKVKQNVLMAFANQDVPFEKMVDRIITGRDLSRSPLFQVFFVLQPQAEEVAGEAGDIVLHTLENENHTCKFDLSFHFQETTSGIGLSVEYATDLFTQATIDRMVANFRQLLISVTRNPDISVTDTDIISISEKQLLLSGNKVADHLPAYQTNMIDLFREQAQLLPDNPAVLFGENQLSYTQLDDLSDKLSCYLQQKYKIVKGDLVGVELPRTEHLIMVLLGVLKSGAAYVPVDSAYPPERKEYIRNDSACLLTIDQAVLDDFIRISGQLPSIDDHVKIQPEDVAYIIYTSGSTGLPKGVVIQHKAVYAFLQWCRKEFASSPYDLVLAVTSVCFDLSVFEIFHSLCNGKTVRVLENALAAPPYLNGQTKILLNTVPSVLGNFLENKINLDAVTVLNLAGEPIPAEYLAGINFRNTEVRNLYGPSEDTTYSTMFRIRGVGPILIGQPIDNTYVYLLNEHNALQPYGARGEICIGGHGLAKGYLCKEKLTSEKFIEDPYKPGARIYCTGDIGKWTAGGELEFLGRKDRQVKIRGFRIEPGEIELCLSRHPAIRSAVVKEFTTAAQIKEMVAYTVKEQGAELSSQDLREFVMARLPAFMCPSRFVELDQLPLTLNGKVDWNRLPEPDHLPITTAVTYQHPQTETEHRLAAIWEELLGRMEVGIHDNFFESGGHSLLATRMMAKIRNSMGVEVPLSLLFKAPTISKLAAYLDSGHKSKEDSPLITIQEKGSRIPVFCTPPAGGHALIYYELAKALGDDQPVYAFQAKGLDMVSEPLKTVQEMADWYIHALIEKQAEGPYILFGYSFGGKVAYEMARQLQLRNKEVRLIVLFDAEAPDKSVKDYTAVLPSTYLGWLLYFKDVYNVSRAEGRAEMELTATELSGLGKNEQLSLFHQKLTLSEPDITMNQLKAYTEVYMTNSVISYVPDEPFPDVPVLLFRVTEELTAFSEEQIKARTELQEGKSLQHDLGWSEFNNGKTEVYLVSCNHIDMMETKNVRKMAEIINGFLN